MTTATVYHEIAPRFGMGAPAPFDAKHYRPVATLQTADLGEVFRLTNSIDAPWYSSREVRSLVGPARSTSVGDIVVLTDESGQRAYRCGMVGWEPV